MKAPKHLSRESRRLWTAILEGYEIDEPAAMVLQATLEARDRREQARAAILKDGATYRDRFGQIKPSPWVGIERDSATTMMRGFRILGFDQEARGELGRPPGR